MLMMAIMMLVLSVFSSCTSTPKSITDLQTFRYNQIGGLESLDPAFAKNLAIMWNVHFLFNTLIEVDSQLNITPSLAKSYEISPDGLTYTFFIRDDVYFHDNPIFPDGKGRKMTAHDIEYSFNRIIDPHTASPGAWIFNDRIDISQPFTAVDDTTFIIRLKQPFGPFLEILSMPYCSVVPKEVVTHYGSDFRNNPCGTGPFKFVLWEEGNVLLLHKNEHYWEKDESGQALPYLDAVKVSFNESRAMELLLLKEDKLDFINGIDGSVKDIVLTKDGQLKTAATTYMQLSKRPYLNTEYIGLLQQADEVAILNNPDIRYAMNIGIDRQKIVTYFRNGAAIPAYYGFTPSLMPGMEDRKAVYPYDPATASTIIQKEKDKHGGNLPLITLSTPESHADMCNFIAQQLIDIGLNVKVQVLQAGILRQMMSQGQVQAFKAQWIADYPDAETYLAFFYGPMPAPPNYTRFRNKAYDAQYEQAIATSDIEARKKQYLQLDELISTAHPVIPLFYDVMLHFTSKNVTGMTANPMNIIDIKRVRKQ